MTKHNALTATFVRQCREAGSYRDGAGLLLRVTPSGAKRWILRITIHGKRRDIGLGSATDVSLLEARERAFELRKRAREGQDPVAAQRAIRTTIPTFREAAVIVHKQRTKAWSNGKHRDQWINSLRDHAYPYIGDRLVSEITTADVLKVLSPIWIEKHETARRVRQRIRTVMEWAIVAGHRTDANPVIGVEAGLPRRTGHDRHHAAMPYQDVPGFITSVRSSDSGELLKLAFEFLILTAARTGEVLGARREEISLNDAVWVVPANRMKARKEHRVPLSDPCVAILERAMEITPKGQLIFPGQRGKPFSNMAMAMLMRRLGRGETVHGFRSAFRDWAAEKTDFPNEVCEAALAHTVENRVERAYRRTDLFEKRRVLMQQWSEYLLLKRADKRAA